MAWIESHQELRDHPKTLMLCEILKKDRPAIVGHLHLLWWWCIDYAPDGSLKKYTNGQIARAADWTGNADEFVTALQKTRFMDGRKVHDWEIFTLHYNLSLERKNRTKHQVRERVKRWRNANVTQSVTHVTPSNAATIPNQPNLTIPNLTNTEPAIAALPRDAFNLIWANYPRKIGKESAASKFKVQVRRFSDWLDIQRALEGYRTYIAKEKVEDKFIKHGSTWFNNQWRDWIHYGEEHNASNGSTGIPALDAIARANREASELRKKSSAGTVSSGV